MLESKREHIKCKYLVTKVTSNVMYVTILQLTKITENTYGISLQLNHEF